MSVKFKTFDLLKLINNPNEYQDLNFNYDIKNSGQSIAISLNQANGISFEIYESAPELQVIYNKEESFYLNSLGGIKIIVDFQNIELIMPQEENNITTLYGFLTIEYIDYPDVIEEIVEEKTEIITVSTLEPLYTKVTRNNETKYIETIQFNTIIPFKNGIVEYKQYEFNNVEQEPQTLIITNENIELENIQNTSIEQFLLVSNAEAVVTYKIITKT